MIRVQQLVKKFGDFTAVDNVSFDVAEGEIFAFLGPNGAGKTTTIKMLTTLLTPTSGTLEIDGLDPVEEQHEVRQRFGIVFQDPSLDRRPDRDTKTWTCTACSTTCRAKCARERIRTAAQALRAVGAQRQPREDILRRHEAAAGNRARIPAHAENPVPRRADARPRSAKPQSALDSRQESEPERRRHRLP